ncbi:hypothetical protein HDU91_003841, partial [Kappamyces sp. JEL0680]
MSHFLVIGDYGSYDFLANMQNTSAAMAALASKTAIDSIITTGDNFYADKVKFLNEGADSVSDPKWKALWKDVFSPVKTIPWYATMGNHDWASANAHSEIDYAAIDPAWKMDDYFYSHTTTTKDGKSVAFIHLDTNLMFYGYDVDPKTNIKYPNILKNFIAAGWTADKHALDDHYSKVETLLQKHSTADYVFTVGHHMIGYTCAVESDIAIPNMKKLQALFEKYKVSAFLHGHSHLLGADRTEAGMLIALSGSGGREETAVCNSTSTSRWTDLTNG